MSAKAMKLLDEINLTVAAIDDVATMLLEMEKRSQGGCCLRVLQMKLEEDLEELEMVINKK